LLSDKFRKQRALEDILT